MKFGLDCRHGPAAYLALSDWDAGAVIQVHYPLDYSPRNESVHVTDPVAGLTGKPATGLSGNAMAFHLHDKSAAGHIACEFARVLWSDVREDGPCPPYIELANT